MDASATSRPSAARPPGVRAPQVFLADSRLALGVLDQLRLLTLKRVFGASPEQANMLTVVLALAATDASLRGAQRIARASRPSAGDTAIGGFLMREAALGIAGPRAREFPLVATFVAGAMIAGIALPELRRAARGLRAAEHRVRDRRIRAYSAATARAARLRDLAP